MQEDRFLNLFYELYDNTPRQGPGSRETTEEAFRLCRGLTPQPSILDLGCGVGAQTLDLARASGGRILAVDNHQPFLAKLDQTATAQGMHDRIEARLGDMAEPGFPEAPFDLVWSEGAVYIIGFDKGLTLWRDLLKPGGCLAVTEVSWLRPDIPAQCREYWQENYPAIQEMEANLAAAQRSGYEVLADFTLPERCWLAEYYTPLEKRLEEMSRKYPGDEAAEAVVEMTRTEIRMYESYSDYYGYQFYVLSRKD